MIRPCIAIRILLWLCREREQMTEANLEDNNLTWLHPDNKRQVRYHLEALENLHEEESCPYFFL
jgi:hypothetical protein